MKAELCDVVVEFIPEFERSFPADAWRVSHPGQSWVSTTRELEDFLDACGRMVDEAEV